MLTTRSQPLAIKSVTTLHQASSSSSASLVEYRCRCRKDTWWAQAPPSSSSSSSCFIRCSKCGDRATPVPVEEQAGLAWFHCKCGRSFKSLALGNADFRCNCSRCGQWLAPACFLNRKQAEPEPEAIDRDKVEHSCSLCHGDTARCPVVRLFQQRREYKQQQRLGGHHQPLALTDSGSRLDSGPAAVGTGFYSDRINKTLPCMFCPASKRGTTGCGCSANKSNAAQRHLSVDVSPPSECGSRSPVLQLSPPRDGRPYRGSHSSSSSLDDGFFSSSASRQHQPSRFTRLTVQITTVPKSHRGGNDVLANRVPSHGMAGPRVWPVALYLTEAVGMLFVLDQLGFLEDLMGWIRALILVAILLGYTSWRRHHVEWAHRFQF